MKEKFCLLTLLQQTALQAAFVRSLLKQMNYIEIDNIFIISCTKTFKDQFSKNLTSALINFVLIHVNLKSGSAVFANGINEKDKNEIKNIVELNQNKIA